MSTMWNAVKKSLNCKSSTSNVHEPGKKNCCKPKTRASATSSLKVVSRSTRHEENQTDCSPMSIRSSDLINPVTNRVRLRSEHQSDVISGPADRGYRPGFCSECGESLARQDAEEHHLSMHAVTEINEGDSTGKIIEMIFATGWTKPENQITIERILRVRTPETKLAQFEEYREMIKIRAHKRQYTKTHHPRCLADGNELLRFYGTALACTLGQSKSSTLCTLQRCNVCRILRHGFHDSSELNQGTLGIFTASTSEIAYRSIGIDGGEARESSDTATIKKALIVCRVIAGRVHKSMVDSSQELINGRSRLSFDSFAGNLGSNKSHVEELYVLKSTALLPCFVIVCQP